jgi:hypothetical protein
MARGLAGREFMRQSYGELAGRLGRRGTKLENPGAIVAPHPANLNVARGNAPNRCDILAAHGCLFVSLHCSAPNICTIQIILARR